VGLSVRGYIGLELVGLGGDGAIELHDFFRWKKVKQKLLPRSFLIRLADARFGIIRRFSTQNRSFRLFSNAFFPLPLNIRVGQFGCNARSRFGKMDDEMSKLDFLWKRNLGHYHNFVTCTQLSPLVLLLCVSMSLQKIRNEKL
jgi:hypothetical protein